MMKKFLSIFLLGFCLCAYGQRYIQVFDKLSNMLASNPQSPQTNAFITGVSDVNDGSQAIFTWVYGSVAVTNSSNCFQSTFIPAVPGRWLRQLYQAVAGGGGGGGTNGLPVVNTMADLVDFAVAGHADTNVWVNGWRTATDGGGGLFARLTSSTATNLGTVFPVAGDSSTRWFRLYTGDLQSGWFGPVADGVTDDTLPVQSALTVISNANGGTLALSGRLAVNSLVGSSNLKLTGVGGATLLQLSGATYVFSVNPGSGGTTNPANNATNIILSGVAFRGRVDTDGFSEFHHLVNLNAVSDVTIEDCQVIGFQGDGIYVGSGNTSSIERHNRRVRVLRTKFDGLNNGNRNGVSVIDCSDITINKCHFTHCSTNNMPGAIDVEPDSTFNIVRNISVTDNTFELVGGNSASVAINIGVNLTAPVQFVTVTGNRFLTNNTGFMWYSTANGRETNDAGLVFANNQIYGTTNWPVIAVGLNGGTFAGNDLDDAGQPSIWGSLAGVSNRVFNVTFGHNRVRAVRNYGMQIFNATTMSVVGNQFIDNGATDGSIGNAIRFSTGSTTNVDLQDNVVTTPLTRTTVAIKKDSDHTFSKASNWESATVLNGVTGDEFQAVNQGTGTPQGELPAPQGTFYQQRDGTIGAIIWVNLNGGTTWATVNGMGVNALTTNNFTIINPNGQLDTDGTMQVDTVNKRAGLSTYAPRAPFHVVKPSGAFGIMVENSVTNSGPFAGIAMVATNANNAADRNWGIGINTHHGALGFPLSSSSSTDPSLGTLPVEFWSTGLSTLGITNSGLTSAIWYGDANGRATNLIIGTNLTLAGNTLSGTGSGSGTVTGSGSSGQMTYWTGPSAISGDANLTYGVAGNLITFTGTSGSTEGGPAIIFNNTTAATDKHKFVLYEDASGTFSMASKMDSGVEDNAINISKNSDGSIQGVSFPNGGVHIFGPAEINGNLTNSTLTASLPVRSSAIKVLTSGAIDISTFDIKGNLAVTNLDSGIGATAGTAWFGDGHWHTPSGGSALVGTVLSNGVASVIGDIASYPSVTATNIGPIHVTGAGTVVESTGASVTNLLVKGMSGVLWTNQTQTAGTLTWANSNGVLSSVTISNGMQFTNGVLIATNVSGSGSIGGSGTATEVAFFDPDTVTLNSDNLFWWDKANKTLVLGLPNATPGGDASLQAARSTAITATDYTLDVSNADTSSSTSANAIGVGINMQAAATGSGALQAAIYITGTHNSTANYGIYYANDYTNQFGAGPNYFGTVGLFSGSGSPETVVTAPIGSQYLDTAGSYNTTAYVKTNGTGNTGWGKVQMTAGGGGGSALVGTVLSNGVASTVGDIASYPGTAATNIAPIHVTGSGRVVESTAAYVTNTQSAGLKATYDAPFRMFSSPTFAVSCGDSTQANSYSSNTFNWLANGFALTNVLQINAAHSSAQQSGVSNSWYGSYGGGVDDITNWAPLVTKTNAMVLLGYGINDCIFNSGLATNTWINTESNFWVNAIALGYYPIVRVSIQDATGLGASEPLRHNLNSMMGQLATNGTFATNVIFVNSDLTIWTTNAAQNFYIYSGGGAAGDGLHPTDLGERQRANALMSALSTFPYRNAISVNGYISANQFVGDGSTVSNLNASSITTGFVPIANSPTNTLVVAGSGGVSVATTGGGSSPVSYTVSVSATATSSVYQNMAWYWGLGPAGTLQGWPGQTYSTSSSGAGSGLSISDPDDTNPYYQVLTTGIVSNYYAFVSDNNAQIVNSLPWHTTYSSVTLDQTNAERVLIGATDSNGSAITDDLGRRCCFFRYSTTLGGTWQCVLDYDASSSGGTGTVVTTVAPDTNPHRYEITYVPNTSVIWAIDGVNVATNTAGPFTWGAPLANIVGLAQLDTSTAHTARFTGVYSEQTHP